MVSKPINKILIASLCGVGDTVLFLSHLNRIQKEYPGAQIDLLVMPNGSIRFLEKVLAVRRIYLYDDNRLQFTKSSKVRDFFKRMRTVWWLKQEKYDLCIWPFAGTTLRKQLLATLIGARQTVMSQAGHFLERLGLFKHLTLVPFEMKDHVFDRNSKLLAALNISMQKPEFSLKITQDEKETVRSLIVKKLGRAPTKIFGFHPCSNTKWTTDKQWPPERFAELADLLSERYGTTSVLLGAPYEKDYLKKIADRMKTPVVEMSELSLLETTSLISQLDLLVGNESSLVHIGGFLGIPTIVIQGPTSHHRTGALGPKAHIVRLDLPCSPCFDVGFTSQCPRHLCMEELTPERIFDTVCQIFENPKGSEDLRHKVHNIPFVSPDTQDWRSLMTKRQQWETARFPQP